MCSHLNTTHPCAVLCISARNCPTQGLGLIPFATNQSIDMTSVDGSPHLRPLTMHAMPAFHFPSRRSSLALDAAWEISIPKVSHLASRDQFWASLCGQPNSSCSSLVLVACGEPCHDAKFSLLDVGSRCLWIDHQRTSGSRRLNAGVSPLPC